MILSSFWEHFVLMIDQPFGRIITQRSEIRNLAPTLFNYGVLAEALGFDFLIHIK